MHFELKNRRLSMASGIVRGAISIVLDDPKLVQSSRSDKMWQFEKNFYDVENDWQIELFDGFCERITGDMKKIFDGLSKRVRCPSTRLWCAFHEQQQSQLVKPWQDLLSKQGLSRAVIHTVR